MKFVLLLLSFLSLSAHAKLVDPGNPKVAEYLRAENSAHLILGGVEIQNPEIEGNVIEWNPFLIGNKKSADLFCKMMGYGESLENHGVAMTWAQVAAYTNKKLVETENGFINIADASTRFFFTSIQCKGI